MNETTWHPVPKAKIRGFEVAKGWEGCGVILPTQATAHSAGYDFYAAEETVIWPSYRSVPVLVPTGVKAYMRKDEYLLLANRSSNPRRGLELANGVGIVDSDYYSNPDNDGQIFFSFWNVSEDPVTVKKGDRIGQGIFMNYLSADSGGTTEVRTGGHGSTGK